MPAGLGRKRQNLAAIAHHRLIGLARPIPFEHREFGVVQRAALPVALDMGESRRCAARRPPAASCRRIRARCGGRAASARRPATAPRSRRRADAPRCRARPGAPPYRPRRNRRSRRSPAGPPRCGCAPSRNGAPVGMDMRASTRARRAGIGVVGSTIRFGVSAGQDWRFPPR